MSELLEKCTVCKGLIDEEDLFCGNCGTESPHQGQKRGTQEIATHSFQCDGCGASMSFDATAQNLRCPFCANESLELIRDQPILAARYVIPMKISREQAASHLKQWLTRGFWRPSDLAEKSVVVELQPIYVPFWKFSVKTKTFYTADSSRTPACARADWFPVSGERSGQYHAILVGASSVLSPEETQQVLPFNFSAAIPRERFELDKVTFEQFRVQRKYARPLARRGVENEERVACAASISGKTRNVKVNVRFEGMSSDPVLLPFWILAYRYQDTVYRFLINGQSGKATGSAPTSWLKVTLAIVGGVALVGLLMLLGLCAGVLTNR